MGNFIVYFLFFLLLILLLSRRRKYKGLLFTVTRLSFYLSFFLYRFFVMKIPRWTLSLKIFFFILTNFKDEIVRYCISRLCMRPKVYRTYQDLPSYRNTEVYTRDKTLNRPPPHHGPRHKNPLRFTSDTRFSLDGFIRREPRRRSGPGTRKEKRNQTTEKVGGPYGTLKTTDEERRRIINSGKL